jgi:hypothetical protein
MSVCKTPITVLSIDIFRQFCIAYSTFCIWWKMNTFVHCCASKNLFLKLFFSFRYFQLKSESNVARYFCFLLSMICFQNVFVFTFRSWWLVRKGYDQNRKQIKKKIINGNCNRMLYHIIHWHIFNRVILNNIFDEIMLIRVSILFLKKLIFVRSSIIADFHNAQQQPI